MTTIITKNSSTAGAVPTASALVQGELAVNVTDKALYTENASGTVVKLNAPSIVDNGNATAITIDSSENVGIGTSSPGTFGKFAVVNSAATSTTQFANSNIWAISNASNADSNIAISNGVDHSAKIGIYNGANLYFALDGAEKMRIDTSGNVGIGTSSPVSKVHAYGAGQLLTLESNADLSTSAGSSFLRFKGTNGNSGYIGFGGTANTLYVSNALSGPMIFETIGAERMRIDSSGNLLVGTTTTGGWTGISKLEAYNTGAAYAVSAFQNSSSTSACYLGRVDNTNAYFARYYYGSSTEVGKITTNGTSTTYGTSSDYRLKENIVPLSGALETVSALKPCNYSWKSNGEVSQGFIAHELAEVIPDAVVGEKDAVDENGNPVYQAIDTSFLVATLTAAIQELNAKVDAQAVEIAALKGQA